MVRHPECALVACRGVAARDPASAERAFQADHALLHRTVTFAILPLTLLRAGLLLLSGEVGKFLQRIARRCKTLTPFHVFSIILQQLVEVPL